MCWRTKFQFTPLREGRHHKRLIVRAPHISIHAPPRGATQVAETRAKVRQNFNSRPSARGDGEVVPGIKIIPRISIHAPPRGATLLRDCSAQSDEISIHAPPRGATRGFARTYRAYRIFQFTPLREGRHCVQVRAVRHEDISIHAPPRGATTSGELAVWVDKISIHAPPRGATRCNRAGYRRSYFNSRPSARGDRNIDIQCTRKLLFQFTPLREGRRQKICNFCKSFVQPLQISMA